MDRRNRFVQIAEGRLRPSTGLDGDMKDRPDAVDGVTKKVETGCGRLYVTVTFHEGKPFEVFAARGKAGGCSAAQMQAFTRAITIGLRSGVDAAPYIKLLKGIRCDQPHGFGAKAVLSCSDAIAGVIEWAIEERKSGDGNI